MLLEADSRTPLASIVSELSACDADLPLRLPIAADAKSGRREGVKQLSYGV